MKMIVNAGVAAAALLIGLGVSGAASATVINFDDLAGGVVVTTQYAGVTFSSSAGENVVTTPQAPPYQVSAPNFICSAPVTGGLDCANDINLDFATGVSGLSFNYTGADVLGSTFKVDIFTNHLFTTFLTFTNTNASNLFATLVDLSAYSNVTRISINSVQDGGGLGFDDFTFTPGDGGVPEPAAWSLMIAGFGLAGAALRRRPRALAV